MQKEFRQIKNAVIKEAEHIRANKISFKNAEMQDGGEQISAYDMSCEGWELQSAANGNGLLRQNGMKRWSSSWTQATLMCSTSSARRTATGCCDIGHTAKAQKLLECAVEQEIDAAQYALGKLYLSDDIDIRDPARGIYCPKQAADNGDSYAAYRLDADAACEWFTTA